MREYLAKTKEKQKETRDLLDAERTKTHGLEITLKVPPRASPAPLKSRLRSPSIIRERKILLAFAVVNVQFSVVKMHSAVEKG